MVAAADRRREERVRFSWPLFFGYDNLGQFSKAQVVDLSRSAVSFTTQDAAPSPGQHVLTRFSFPHAGGDGFDMGSYFDWAEVVRVDHALNNTWRVAAKLRERLAVPLTQEQAEEDLVMQSA